MNWFPQKEQVTMKLTGGYKVNWFPQNEQVTA